MRSTAVKPLACAVILASLAGCGGGGGSTAPSPGPAPAPAFALVSSTPDDAAVAVPRTTAPLLSFNADIAPASLTASGVTLTGPLATTVAANRSVSGSTVKVSPVAGALPGDTRYELRVATSINDLAGRSLPATLVRSFTTAPQAWGTQSTAVARLSNFTSGRTPLATMDAAGAITAVWMDRVGAIDVLLSARLEAGSSTWSAPVTVYKAKSWGVLGGIQLPGVLNGETQLTWSESDNGETRFVHATRDASTGIWSAPAKVAVLPAEAGPTAGALVQLDASQGLQAFAYGRSSEGAGIHAAQYDAARRAWGSPKLLLPMENPVEWKVQPDQQGNVMAYWILNASSSRELFAAYRGRNAATWGAARKLDASVLTGASDDCLMAVGPTGDFTIGWTSGGSIVDTPSVQVTRYTPASNSWSSTTQLNVLDPKYPGAALSKLVADESGAVTVAWSEYTGVHVSRYSPGTQTWGPPNRVLAGNAIGSLVLAADPVGNITLLGEQDRKLRVQRFSATSGGWQEVQTISAPAVGEGIFVNMPVALSDATGKLTVLWFAQNSLGNGTSDFPLSSNQFR